MTGLVDRLATVMRVRDMEQLDRALTLLLCENLTPLEVGVAVFADQGDGAAWWTRACCVPGQTDPTPTADQPHPIEEMRPVLHQAARTQHWHRAAAPQGHLSAFPLFTDWDGEGVLWLRTRRPLGERRLKLVISLLRFYANFRDLVAENERDTLTGLLNRKTFDASFSRIALATSFQADTPPATDDRRDTGHTAPCWLVVTDIDHFKRVNDQFGHLIGDEVLLLTARLMRNSFRLSDRVFRFGGEEFVLMLHNAEPVGALQALEKFRKRVDAYEYPQVGHVTLSLGCTRIEPDDTPDSAFTRADQAVYAAKEDGRNRVYCFEDLVAKGRLAAQEKSGTIDFF